MIPKPKSIDTLLPIQQVLSSTACLQWIGIIQSFFLWLWASEVIFCPVITNGITFLSTWSRGLVMTWPLLFNLLCFLYIWYNFFSEGRRATQLHTLSKTEGQISYLITIIKTNSQQQDWQQTRPLNSFAVLARTDVTMIYPWIICRCSKNTLNSFCKYS